MSVCLCGCGQQLPPATGKRGRPQVYVDPTHRPPRPHDKRTLALAQRPSYPCSCGCGELIPGHEHKRKYLTIACQERAMRERRREYA